jgi:hypothetical protein
MSGGPRWALYFAPAAHRPSWTTGRRWPGRDAESGARCDGGPHRGDPCRCGFLATLRPPFPLREGTSRAQLLAAPGGCPVSGLAGTARTAGA